MILDDVNLKGKVNDIHMMVCPGGRERTKEEFENLFNESGFILNKIINTETQMSIIEALPD